MDIHQALIEAVRSSMEGVTLADPNQPDCPLIYVNDAFCAMSGYSRRELIGRNCRLLQGEMTSLDTIQAMGDAIKQGRAGLFELYNYRKNGEGFWNRLSLTPIRDGGSLCYIAGFQSDVTALRQAMVTMQAHQAELKRMLDMVNGTVMNTLRAMEGKYQDAAFMQQSCLRLTGSASAIRTMIEHDSTEIVNFVRLHPG